MLYTTTMLNQLAHLLPLTAAALFSIHPSSSDSYTINDILFRYRNLTAQQREISFYKEQPQYDTSCVRTALDPILGQCLKSSVNDIDPQLRAATAAKLSVCEFEVAGIEYPEECHGRKGGYFFGGDSVDYALCVMTMEKRSQWWTTYSGYYRSIGEICLQESLPYEKEEIWKMFLDVTEHYENVFEVLQDYVDASEKFKMESKASFEKMSSLMNQMKASGEQNMDKIDMMWEYITKQMERLSSMSVAVTTLAKEQTDSLESNILSFFQSIDTRFTSELETLRNRFLSDLEQRDLLMSTSVEATRAALLTLNRQLSSTYEISKDLHLNVEASSQSADSLNESLSSMNGIVDSLKSGVKDATDVITTMNDVLLDNVLVRGMLFVASDWRVKLEAVLVTVTLTVVTFATCVMVSYRVNVFKYVGIFVVSVVVGSCLGTVFLLVGKVVDQELEKRVMEGITNRTESIQ